MPKTARAGAAVNESRHGPDESYDRAEDARWDDHVREQAEDRAAERAPLPDVVVFTPTTSRLVQHFIEPADRALIDAIREHERTDGVEWEDADVLRTAARRGLQAMAELRRLEVSA